MSTNPGLQRLREAQEELEELVRSDPALSDEERAEGYLLIAGLYKWGVDRAIVGADTQRPRFLRFMDTFSKWGLGNPDNLYLVAEIDNSQTYRINGHRGTCIDMLIEVRTGIGRREDDVHSETISFLEARNLDVRPDGGFEVYLGGPPRAGNHLALPPHATTIFVRQTLADWTTETIAMMEIERLGPAPGAAPPLSLAAATQQLTRAGDIVLALGRFNDRTAQQWRASLPINSFPAPSAKVGDGFFPGQHSAIAQFKLDHHDLALIVTLDPVDADYLGFSVGSLKYHMTFDYHNRQCSLNTRQASRSSDGRYRYVISSADPGVQNWIDTGGKLEGVMFFRCQGLRGANLGQPRVALVRLSELRDALPTDEPRITPAERRESLKQRQLGAYRRFAY